MASTVILRKRRYVCTSIVYCNIIKEDVYVWELRSVLVRYAVTRVSVMYTNTGIRRSFKYELLVRVLGSEIARAYRSV